MNKHIQRWALAACTGLALSSGAWAVDAIPHVSGGVGVEEFNRLQREASQYNLRLLLVSRGSGAYLADVEVTVAALPSREVMLDTRTDGPLLLATLPPGRYQITANYGGDVNPGARRTQTRVIQVPPQGQVRTAMSFDTPHQVAPDSPRESRLN